MSVYLPKRSRKRKRSRKWPGRSPRKLGWQAARSAAGVETAKVCDHIVPERFILTHCKGADPHAKINLMWLTPALHGVKTGADAKLCRGDFLAYAETLRTNGWDMSRVEAAFEHFGIKTPLMRF